jgi:hypothetical protein
MKVLRYDQGLEAFVCIIVSFALIFHFIFKPESDITKAVEANDTVKIRELIKESGNLDEPGPSRQTHSLFTTPLIEAAWLGRTEILTELITAGANVNARDDMGTTPLMAALSSGNVQTSLVLMEKGADPNIAACIGHGSCTVPLRCARQLNNTQLINKIISAGGREDTPTFFTLECFWIDAKQPVLMGLTQILPLVLFIMLGGGFIRRRLRKKKEGTSK